MRQAQDEQPGAPVTANEKSTYSTNGRRAPARTRQGLKHIDVRRYDCKQPVLRKFDGEPFMPGPPIAGALERSTERLVEIIFRGLGREEYSTCRCFDG
jgi:hypothetical protein